MFLHGTSTTTLNVSAGHPDDRRHRSVAGDIAGTGNLVKTGDGTLILGGNTYSGGTTLDGGRSMRAIAARWAPAHLSSSVQLSKLVPPS